jgi:hypothetical protein
MLRPEAVIWAELPSGERYRVERSMTARRWYAGSSVAVYAIAFALAVI